MFAVVCAEEGANRGILNRLRRLLGRQRLSVCRCDFAGGFYYRVTTNRDFDKLDWSELAALTGKCAMRLLLPRGTEPPTGLGCGRFNTDGYRRALLTEAAVRLVAAAAINKPQIGVGLVDIGANTAQLVPRLLEHAQSVTVLTARVEEYESYAAEVYRKMGVCPLVGDSAEVFEHCRAIIAPYGLGGVTGFNFGGVIFAPKEQGCIDVIEGSLMLPDGVEVPPQIAPFDFVAACWQLLGREDYIHLPFMLGTVSGAQVDIKRLIDKI